MSLVKVSWFNDKGKTAEGKELYRGQIGVAHKSLPFGTWVKFTYNGRSTEAPVVDRGPYIAGRTYDLLPASFKDLAPLSQGVLLAEVFVLGARAHENSDKLGPYLPDSSQEPGGTIDRYPPSSGYATDSNGNTLGTLDEIDEANAGPNRSSKNWLNPGTGELGLVFGGYSVFLYAVLALAVGAYLYNKNAAIGQLYLIILVFGAYSVKRQKIISNFSN